MYAFVEDSISVVRVSMLGCCRHTILTFRTKVGSSGIIGEGAVLLLPLGHLVWVLLAPFS